MCSHFGEYVLWGAHTEGMLNGRIALAKEALKGPHMYCEGAYILHCNMSSELCEVVCCRNKGFEFWTLQGFLVYVLSLYHALNGCFGQMVREGWREAGHWHRIEWDGF